MSASAYSDKTFLVTGGAGFIGSHLCKRLLSKGARVINVDNYNDFYDPRIKQSNVQPLRAYEGQFLDYPLDILDKNALEAVFKEWGSSIDQVIHLAARAGVRPSLEQPELYLETNVTGTLHLLEAMRTYGIEKMVFASSSSVYGNRTDSPFREDQDISKPISPYAATKAMGESLLHTYSHLYGIHVVALRFFTVYGPSQRPDLAIHKFTRLIDQSKPIPVFGDGSTGRDYTFIDDILQGIEGAIQYHETPFEVINLGGSHPIRLAELISRLEEGLGKKAIIDRQPMQPGDVVFTCADTTKAKLMLGYDPQTPFEQGLLSFLDWYRTHQAQSMTLR